MVANLAGLVRTSANSDHALHSSSSYPLSAKTGGCTCYSFREERQASVHDRELADTAVRHPHDVLWYSVERRIIRDEHLAAAIMAVATCKLQVAGDEKYGACFLFPGRLSQVLAQSHIWNSLGSLTGWWSCVVYVVPLANLGSSTVVAGSVFGHLICFVLSTVRREVDERGRLPREEKEGK